MNQAELKIKIDLFDRELKQLRSIKVECKSCEHYTMHECLRWQSRPPPEVVQHGCEEWTYDFIPF